MDISDNGLNMIKQQEGLRLTVYADVVGHMTVGYGHKDDSMTEGDTITQDQADQYLQDDVEIVVSSINDIVTVSLNQNQFDALCDFEFNLGAGSLKNSTLLKLLNQGDYDGAAAQFPLWDHAGGKVNQDLLNRRNAEAALFQS